ncbi:Zinc finger ZZ-type [Penicillium cf. griseofulvum]|uniref:Zinc finger ZZ-type n=1 Tax=Penicillium cf. griseofulvum TaxID=2972120 RepID=A0A9W9T6H2_9EURO|nr:Zinc finger ZZ-type [Penicillium cf. griseofulvum]KAJ5421696.1 Zinc finger ZZ-type [Penicillium cf. griseofulvum]KAJ5427889.1 Zinc finger ZZ-type [Penicillium cf. griseofulvum]
MTTPSTASHSGPDHLVTVKVLYNDSNRRFKVPLKELKAQVFPQLLRTLLGVPADVNVILERYSDSAGSYVRLDCDNIAVYKQLYRAAKAKSKLRIKVTTLTSPDTSAPTPVPSEPTVPMESINHTRNSYLETVLSPLAPPNTIPLVDSAEVPHPTGEKQVPLGQPRYRPFEMDQEKHQFPVISHASSNGMFCIDCNHCGRSIANAHYHCSICENGDYDLCLQCVGSGTSCRGEGHWLIKRTVKDGVVTNSTTETIAPRDQSALEFNPILPTQIKREVITKPVVHVPESVQESIPEPITEPITEPIPEPIPEPVAPSACLDVAVPGDDKPMCNGCCREADESNLVRCNDCEDYDLCLRCLLRNKHGHHPGHTFHLGSDRNFCLKNLITSRCLPGRQFRHAAVCDGCDKRIVGVRHKCLACPDWDFCPDCILTAPQNHPGHRFVQVYETIGEPAREHEIHYGIFCDGPLCKNKPAQSYINGVRYKCAVCDDTDFCASCEALPTDHHNRTHPLVKFNTPVRNVTVKTVGDDGSSGPVALGDQLHTSTRLLDQAELEEQEPVEVDASKPVENVEPEPFMSKPIPEAESSDMSDYTAFFIRDTVTDGTKMSPNTMFRQTWTLYNPGPAAWPVSCDVRFVGGDKMFNVDIYHPSSIESIRSAMESNKLLAPVEPGESADFTVNLRTPNHEGPAISYWRLKLPNGVAIGHRLWCDVEVQTASLEETDTSETYPAVSEIAGSGMIFPKLEKESPESSTHQAEAPAPQAPTLSNSSEVDVLEDVESLTLDDASTDADTGFLTDEEYDVLDASDQEYLDAKQSTN